MTMNMRFFIIAAAATLLAACTQENEVQNKAHPINQGENSLIL